MNEPVVLGAVPFLNAAPLTWTLGAPGDGVRLRVEAPARLADLVAAGEVAAALVPVRDVFALDLEVVPGVAIATRGSSESARLYLKRPVEQVRTIAVDARSRTTNALARVLLRRRWGVEPRAFEYDPDRTAPEAVDADAAVVIGDVWARRTALPWLDLGRAWVEATGRPFVFAVWAHRRGEPRAERLHDLLRSAAREGRERIGEIATRLGPRAGLSRAGAERYLTRAMWYELGPQEREGMELFRRWVEQEGLR